jgi:hypothetical protein
MDGWRVMGRRTTMGAHSRQVKPPDEDERAVLWQGREGIHDE